MLGAAPAAAVSGSGCSLGPRCEIKHVIILQFDNFHLRRDNPNVPSDLEQIPALYNFLKGQGTLLSNDHTALISHTADGITSTETGLYPGNEGLGVANSFEYFVPFGSGTANASAFTYWTDPVSSADNKYEMIFGRPTASNPMGINTPAPWVPFTRAGCDFGGIGSANMEFENDTSDVANVYGGSSPAAVRAGQLVLQHRLQLVLPANGLAAPGVRDRSLLAAGTDPAGAPGRRRRPAGGQPATSEGSDQPGGGADRRRAEAGDGADAPVTAGLWIELSFRF